MTDLFSPNENEKLQKTLNSLKSKIQHLEGKKALKYKIVLY